MNKAHCLQIIIDPLGHPTVPAVSDHYFCTCFCPSIHPSPLFKTSQNKRLLKVMITTGGTVGLAEGIIDDIYVL